ncbi:hypothetical protein Dsin_003286 [Dipteronia sinensis]|uniref:EF-hand domain-containing protein n=1 Tax=Dipteronia sinensis TaxID=43782 RepID=A0AAE0B8R0_9ROSI|nr:hypothetical protein Dsin_003286 [Dipteronia sinensis]
MSNKKSVDKKWRWSWPWTRRNKKSVDQIPLNEGELKNWLRKFDENKDRRLSKGSLRRPWKNSVQVSQRGDLGERYTMLMKTEMGISARTRTTALSTFAARPGAVALARSRDERETTEIPTRDEREWQRRDPTVKEMFNK